MVKPVPTLAYSLSHPQCGVRTARLGYSQSRCRQLRPEASGFRPTMERPKLKLLALHSFRTSADIFKEQV